MKLDYYKLADMKSFLLFVDDGAVSFAVLCKIDRDKKQLCAA